MATIKAFIIAITKFFEIFGPLLETLSGLLNDGLKALIEFFVLKNKRLEDQIKQEKEQNERALRVQKAKEAANVAAFNSLVEEAWAIRYNDILEKIKIGEYSQVIMLTKGYDDDELNNILFDDTQSAEYRAMKIVKLIKSSEE